MKKTLYLFILVIFSMSCSFNSNTDSEKETSENNAYQQVLQRVGKSYNSIKIEEVLQTDNYSYIKYTQDGNEFWGAVAARAIEKGETYYYRDAMEMKNFESKSLNRVFPSIWFINNIFDELPNESVKEPGKSENLAMGHNKAEDIHEQIKVEKAENGYSLAEIFENKTDLKGKDVLVRGRVVKLNKNIMNTNWVHIQDGTSYNNLFDLTITTPQTINFELGDVVTFKGRLSLNKDFGYGYKYDYIIENAEIQ
jgi:hypothetical protein